MTPSIACWITSVTACGWEIMITWDPSTSVIADPQPGETKLAGTIRGVPARALFHTAPRCVEIRELATPRPAAGEVLVRTLCSGISGGTERLVYRGEVPAELGLDDTLDALAGSFSYPFA